ncbi:S27A2-like protein [Mya arenaria]|uniref:Long-chain-fatty-acid--CoA ligase n=1 Tax=Mya arenaria TaxID=6604 RepID=A0ABY7DJF7_MYAAR|nr:S27A2-like protein [Mya arenaria]
MPTKKDKLILGTAGAVGAGILSWRAFFPWIGYDLRMMKNGGNAGKKLMADQVNKRFLINMFEEAVEKYPKKPFIIFEDRIYTYEFVDQQTNRVANIAAKWGLKVGDCLQKLGIAVAFINFHIRGQPLIHTLKASEAKALIIGAGDYILPKIEEVRGELGDLPIFIQGQPLMVGPAYTSLPKPAIISQAKAIGMSKFFQLFYFKPSDIVYTVTPLYHSAAGVGLMSTLDQGATMVLRRKFSAQHFFEDVRRHNVTVLQYIGELCRYLLAVPESPLDSKHCCRVAVGNGLRSDIWEKFKNRYKIPQICEFFGATEGTNKLDPTPKLLVKVDVDTGDAIRNKKGLCIPVATGETGLLLGTIPPNYQNLQFYKGGREINEKKVLRNVVKEGDAFFNFGDLLSSEGRAGMAAIHLEGNMQLTPKVLKDIFNHCKENLPNYSRPLFIRFPKEESVTVTHKQQKTQLRKDGFHPENIDDPLFYYNEAAGTYTPLTLDNFQSFLTKSRL